MNLAALLPAGVFAVMAVFARIGSAMVVLPGFGDLYVPARFRLILAFFLSALVAASLGTALPAPPSAPAAMLAFLAIEIAIGLFLGTLARIILAALEVAGEVVSLQIGLSAATVINPALSTSGSVVASMLSVLGVLVVFLADAHHLMLRALVESYGVFAPGAPLPTGDLATAIVKGASSAFRLGLELAAPLLVAGLVFTIGLGLISKLMPQFQVLFVAAPAQIMGGIIIVAITLTVVLRRFLDAFVGWPFINGTAG